MRPIPSLWCLACGGEVEASLASLGSSRCHDCRDTSRPLDPAHGPNGRGTNGHAERNGGSAVTLTVRLRDAAQVADLLEFLRVRACDAERARGNHVVVRPHPTLRPAHVRAELEALLGAWQATRPGARPVLIG
jgi:hypothetical protein